MGKGKGDCFRSMLNLEKGGGGKGSIKERRKEKGIRGRRESGLENE